MMQRRHLRIGLGLLLAVVVVAGSIVLTGALRSNSRTMVTAYFDNSNGIFVGDDVVMLGVRIGRIESIEPQPDRAKITFWFDRKYQVPAEAGAVILSPQLITSRAIQLTPAYTGGAEMTDDAVIPQSRTAVPVEWDDFRQQLEKLSSSLQPGPGGTSPMGEFVDVAAQNLRGRGADIRTAIIELSRALSALGDHSTDIFGTVKNLATLVSGLQSSTALMKELNLNLAGATALLADHPAQIGEAVEGLNTATQDITAFISAHREALGVTSDKLGSVAQALVDSTDDIKQVLHLVPTTFQNLINIFEPAHSALTGALVMNNFANPIQFLCGAIQAASRLNAEHAAKLCVQYLAPIMKNRQYNFPPIGLNPIVNAAARPNEVTYSENWLRPDHRVSPHPGEGLSGLMVPPGVGS